MQEVRHRRLIALASLITLMAQPCYVFSRDRASHVNRLPRPIELRSWTGTSATAVHPCLEYRFCRDSVPQSPPPCGRGVLAELLAIPPTTPVLPVLFGTTIAVCFPSHIRRLITRVPLEDNLVGFARSTKYSVLPSRYELVLCKKCTCTPLTRCVSLLTQVRTLNLRLRLAAQEGRLSQP